MLHQLLRRTAIKGGNLNSQTSVNLLPSGILFSLWMKLVRNQYRYSVTFTTPDVSITQHYVIYMMNLQPSWYKIHRVTANSFFGYKVLDWAHNYKMYWLKNLTKARFSLNVFSCWMMASLYFNKVLADIIWHQSIISCVSTVSLVPMDRPPVCDGKRDGSLLCNFFELLRMFLQKEYTNTVLTNLTSTNSSNTALIKSSANVCLRFIEVWDVSSLHIGLGYHSDGYCFLYNMWTCLHCENF